MNTPTEAEITEALIVEWLTAKTRELLTRYPQCTGAAIGMMIHMDADSTFPSHQVHLIGKGWRECGTGPHKSIEVCEHEAAASIETPAKILKKAREDAARSARNLAELESQLGGAEATP